MKLGRKIGFGFSILLALFIVLAIWYKYAYSMDEVVPWEVNSQKAPTKIVLATQGSEFKNEITQNITEHYKLDPVYLKIIDIKLLANVNPMDYDAIVILHTWENWKPPTAVKDFTERAKPYKEKIIMLSTSGSGSSKIEDFDALAGESILEKTEEFSNQIILKIDSILSKKE